MDCGCRALQRLPLLTPTPRGCALTTSRLSEAELSGTEAPGGSDGPSGQGGSAWNRPGQQDNSEGLYGGTWAGVAGPGLWLGRKQSLLFS